MSNPVSVMHSLCDQLYYWTYGTALKATPENLKWVLRQNSKDILKYTFQEGDKIYTIQEYAIKLEECGALSTLKNLGVDFEYSPALLHGTLLHFYLSCLSEDHPPHLPTLNLIIDSVSDINRPEFGYCRTPIEYALEKMANFKKIHWEVIETLFKRGATIEVNDFSGTTPFKQFINSQACNNAEEEKRFLSHLAHYLKLEKEYFPNSSNTLSLDKFKSLTTQWMVLFGQKALDADINSSLCQSVNSMANQMHKEDFEKERPAPQDELLSQLKGMVYISQNRMIGQERVQLAQLAKMFTEYHELFQSLVKEGEFKECFDRWILTSAIPAFERSTNPLAKLTVIFFKNCGLISETPSLSQSD